MAVYVATATVALERARGWAGAERTRRAGVVEAAFAGTDDAALALAERNHRVLEDTVAAIALGLGLVPLIEES